MIKKLKNYLQRKKMSNLTSQEMQALDRPIKTISDSGLTSKQFEKMLAESKTVRMISMVNTRAALREACASKILAEETVKEIKKETSFWRYLYKIRRWFYK